MRALRELFTLHFEQGLSQREIARSLGVVRSTVERTLARFAAARLSWPVAMSDDELEAALYRQHAHQMPAKVQTRPNYAAAIVELARKGVTRQLLWREYRVLHPDGIGYSVYCDELAAFQSERDVAYRHDHQPGVRGYFDFAGSKLAYQCDGRQLEAHIFVATLGYSGAIFAYAYADETAPSWLDGQARSFRFFGGVPQVLVPDNPKALVSKACHSEPQITAVYRDFAAHYCATVIPARVRKPKDKASVEGGVRIITNRMAAVRDRVFDSLEALNTWLVSDLSILHTTPFQKRVGSRENSLLEERAALSPLPAQDFEMPRYLQRKVAIDYHVEVDKRYYSVPYQHVGKQVEVRVTRHVEILLDNVLIALHPIQTSGARHITVSAHMPIHHQRYRDPKLQGRAESIGPNTAKLIDAVFQKRLHPEQAIRSAHGVLGLVRDCGKAALEAACEQALYLQTISYQSVRLLIAAQRQPREADPYSDAHTKPNALHEHVRGGGYFDSEQDELKAYAHQQTTITTNQDANHVA
jgi:transposase